MIGKIFKQNLKTVLAIIWFAFTFSLVAWWWVFFLFKMTESTSHTMFAWEGSILLAAILIGGIALIVFSYRDQQRHKRMLFFFATFSHDIKTSIARLRLQAEVLEEELHGQAHPVLKRLVNDIHRLDLQLENSLQLANFDEGATHLEEVSLKSLVATLRNEFPDLSIELEKDAMILGDRRALISVLRNLLQNSVQHGKASIVRFKVKALSASRLEIIIQDNGLGYKGSLQKLGSEILVSTDPRGNGIGLLITKRLLGKMNGDVVFSSAEKEGFVSTLRLGGRL